MSSGAIPSKISKDNVGVFPKVPDIMYVIQTLKSVVYSLWWMDLSIIKTIKTHNTIESDS